MRLRQIARKLEVETSIIIDFLSHQNIIIEDQANTKLDDTQVELVMKEFGKEEVMETSPLVEESVPEEKPKAKKKSTTKASTTKTAEKPLKEKAKKAEEVKEETNPEGESVEVIKAPKMSLDGLKVVGKIELPETPSKFKKKEESAKADSSNAEAAIPASVQRDGIHPSKKARESANQIGKKLKSKSAAEVNKQDLNISSKKSQDKEEQKTTPTPIKSSGPKKKRWKQNLKQEQEQLLRNSTVVTDKRKESKRVVQESKAQNTEPKGNIISRFWKWMNT